MNKYKEILKDWETPFAKSSEEAWQELSPKLSAKMTAKVITFSWKPLISVAAAAAVIVGIVLFWPAGELIKYEAAVGKIQIIDLPDHSVATLNAGSVISYNDDWSKERTLNLSGEAFFEVSKGSKFSVVTDAGIVEVLGTSFNVFARGERFRVECNTGKVRVIAGKSQLDITPGNAAELAGKQLVLSNFDLGLNNWRSGEFKYENTPVVEVFEEMERQFAVHIEIPDLNNRMYTGRFSNKSLEEALELVCLPMSLRFEIVNENQVFIAERTR